MSIPSRRRFGEALDRLVANRAETVARRLFPDEIADGNDCKNFYENPGKPCPICAERNQRWNAIIEETRKAIQEAFR